MKHLLFLILFLVITPVVSDKSKGLFSGEILQADLDSFTSNVSETPGYLSDDQSAIQSNPQNTEDWMDVGKTQLKSGNWKPAEETFSKVIDKDPKNPDGWEGYLLAIRGGGNFEELLDASERATNENPDFASAWKYDGIALSSLDRSEEALAAFDKAIETDPKFSDAWYYKGIALNSLKRYSDAIKSFDEVLTISPQNTKAWNNKGVALHNAGRFDDAIAAFDKTLEIDSTFIKASENKAMAIQEKGKNSLGSVVTIDDALSITPSPTSSDAGGGSAVITVSPTRVPVTNSDTYEVQSPDQTPVPTSSPTPPTSESSTSVMLLPEQISSKFSSDIKSGSAPLTVHFKDHSSGQPVMWSWDFGDGSSDMVANPVHVYSIPGRYSVTHSVSSQQGGTDTKTEIGYIEVVKEGELIANFTSDSRSGKAPLTVHFKDASSGHPTLWSWDFGDGASDLVVANPVHVYEKPGNYTVTLTTSNQEGAISTIVRKEWVKVYS